MKKQASQTGARVFLILLALVLACGSVAVFLLDTRTDETVFDYVSKHRTGVGQLTDQPVTQAFTFTQDHPLAVEVMFSNYNKKPKSGTLTLTLTDSTGKEVASQTWEVSELRNNAFVSLPLTVSVDHAAGSIFTLNATSTCTEGKGVTLRMGDRAEDAPAGTLTLADGSVDTESMVNLRVVYGKKTYGWQGAYALAALTICALLCLPLTGKERKHA